MSLSTSLPTMPSTWAYSEQENESFFMRSLDVPSAFYEKDSEVVKGFETVVVYFNDNFHLLTRVKFETFYRLDESKLFRIFCSSLAFMSHRLLKDGQ